MCRGVKYHEPEYWKFGEEGNKYFRHATGQIYAISKDLATYISVNRYKAFCHRRLKPSKKLVLLKIIFLCRHILHRYANEDVSLGSWFIGLDVEHIDERSLCCGTPPGKIASIYISQTENVLFSCSLHIGQYSLKHIITFRILTWWFYYYVLDCEWKAQAGNPCAASFDWSCSGICKSAERMEEVHQRCGEGDGEIWHRSSWKLHIFHHHQLSACNMFVHSVRRASITTTLPHFCILTSGDSW